MPPKKILCFITLTAAVISSQAFAGGYFIGDQGAQAQGRAGAFTAKADDPSAIDHNPAGLARQRGTQIYLSNRFANVNEQFTRAPTLDWGNAPGGVPPYVEFDPVSNSEKWQLLDPMIVVATDFGLENWGFALGAYAPPGISKASFPADGSNKYLMTKRDVKILYYNASVAWKYKDVFGIGASLQWVDLADMEFKLVVDGNVTGQVYPVSSPYDIGATLKGADHFSLSSIVGAWYRPVPFFEMAASARIIPNTLLADCTLDVELLSPDLHEGLDTDIVLSRNGQLANDVTLSLPAPATFRLGFRYIHLKGAEEVFDVEFDVGMEAWSSVDRFEMDGNGMRAAVLGANMDIDSLTMEKHWKNSYSFRLGGDYSIIPEHLKLRAGVFYETPAAKQEYANIDFFSAHQIGSAAGVSVSFLGAEIALAYTYVYQIPFSVTEGEGKIYQQAPGSNCVPPYTEDSGCDEHYLGQPSPTVNGGTYKAEYHFLSLSAMYTF